MIDRTGWTRMGRRGKEEMEGRMVGEERVERNGWEDDRSSDGKVRRTEEKSMEGRGGGGWIRKRRGRRVLGEKSIDQIGNRGR